ncbi:hypothetical protein BGZ88_010482 [Linnemannia elongata]|nr:hypothetical protein BGZ88_010482 [Linnemannia elongata]
MVTARTLEMAEIARLIGLNILLFDPPSRTLAKKKSYLPQTLLNCCLVSKSWRAILLPVLWRCYDGRLMGLVPRLIIVQYRSLFQYCSGQVTDFTVEARDDSESSKLLGLQELLTRCPRLERLTTCPVTDYGLLRRFIRHVSPLPRLGTMMAVRVTCVRNINKRL